jgi:hypothetical protein
LGHQVRECPNRRNNNGRGRGNGRGGATAGLNRMGDQEDTVSATLNDVVQMDLVLDSAASHTFITRDHLNQLKSKMMIKEEKIDTTVS